MPLTKRIKDKSVRFFEWLILDYFFATVSLILWAFWTHIAQGIFIQWLPAAMSDKKIPFSDVVKLNRIEFQMETAYRDGFELEW